MIAETSDDRLHALLARVVEHMPGWHLEPPSFHEGMLTCPTSAEPARIVARWTDHHHNRLRFIGLYPLIPAHLHGKVTAPQMPTSNARADRHPQAIAAQVLRNVAPTALAHARDLPEQIDRAKAAYDKRAATAAAIAHTLGGTHHAMRAWSPTVNADLERLTLTVRATNPLDLFHLATLIANHQAAATTNPAAA